MPDPHQERMDALTSANLGLLRRVAELERRVAALESGMQAAPVPEEAPVIELEEAPLPPPPPPAPSEPPSPAPDIAAEPVPATSAIDAAETAVGLNWVNRIGALTLVIGAAFFFKYAVDNEWIGPAGRILLGLLAGGLTCGFGFRTWLKGHSIFAQGICAAGLALLYLSLWAAYSLYHLVPAALAFGGMVSITLFSAALAWRFGAMAMAALGMAGGYFTPVLLSSGDYRPWFFSSYMFMLNAGWLWLARRRGWSRLEWLAAGFTGLFGAEFLDSLHRGDRGPIGSYSFLTQYAVFSLSPVRWLVYLAQLVAGVGVSIAWEDHVWQAGGLMMGLLAAGFLIADWRGYRPLPLIGWTAFTAGVMFLIESSARPLQTWPLFGVATAGFALALLFTLAKSLPRFDPPGRFELLMLVSPGLCYFLEGHLLLSIDDGAWRGLFAALLAAVYLAAGWWVWNRQPAEARDRRPVVFCGGATLVLITAAIALQFAGFRITMLWAAEAAALAWLASRYELPALRIPVVLLSLFVLFRLVVIDAEAYRDPQALPLLMNLRFMTCFVSAAALGCAAWLLRTHILALAPYLAAHAALLFGLALENYSWVLRTTPLENRMGAIAAGLGVLGAAYGLALVVAGVITRTRLNRLLGLGLLAVVVLKLYLADVWMMDRLSRILAFSALGGLLLATSFFYSRFRARIEAWVKDDPSQTA